MEFFYNTAYHCIPPSPNVTNYIKFYLLIVPIKRGKILFNGTIIFNFPNKTYSIYSSYAFNLIFKLKNFLNNFNLCQHDIR